MSHNSDTAERSSCVGEPENAIDSVDNSKGVPPTSNESDNSHMCANGHIWPQQHSNVGVPECLACEVIECLKSLNTDAITWWEDFDPNCDHFMMVCDNNHRFIVSSKPTAIKRGCGVCEMLRELPEGIATNIVSMGGIHTRAQVPLPWFCKKCRLPFLASTELLKNQVGVQTCSHAVKIGGAAANSVIAKNIIEAIYSVGFDGYGSKFGKYRPIAYSTDLKIALHYENPRVNTWTAKIREICARENIKLIYIPHETYTARTLTELIVREVATITYIPDVEWMIEEIIPGAFMTVPREPLVQSFNSRREQQERQRLEKIEIAHGHTIPPISHPWRGPQLPVLSMLSEELIPKKNYSASSRTQSSRSSQSSWSSQSSRPQSRSQSRPQYRSQPRTYTP